MNRHLIFVLAACLIGCAPNPVDFSKAREGYKLPPPGSRTVADMRDGETACGLVWFLADGTPFLIRSNLLTDSCAFAVISKRDGKYAVRIDYSRVDSMSYLPSKTLRDDWIPVLVENPK